MPGQVVFVPNDDAGHGRVVLQRQPGVRVDATSGSPLVLRQSCSIRGLR